MRDPSVATVTCSQMPEFRLSSSNGGLEGTGRIGHVAVGQPSVGLVRVMTVTPTAVGRSRALRKLAPVVVVLAAVVAVIGWKVRHHGASATAHEVERCPPIRARVPRPAAVPARVSGHVTNKSGGAVGGALIALVQTEPGADFDSAPLFTTADASGVWTIEKVPPGQYVASATASGFLPINRARFAITANERRGGIDFSLEPGGTRVAGKVSDSRGNPIAGARVVAELAEGRAPYLALTDADGKYELSLPDGKYWLGVHHDDYVVTHHSIELAGTPNTTDFKLVLGGTIHGVVVARATGKPVPEALIVADNGHRGPDSRVEATTDVEGKFVLHCVAPGAILLEASADRVASAEPTRVGIGTGELVDGVRVLVDPAVSICGRVVEKGTRNGIAGATLRASMIGPLARTPDPTGVDGAFEIVGVNPGSNLLLASADNKISARDRRVDVADRDVTGVIVEMSTGATLTGRVNPPRRATISIVLQDDRGFAHVMESVAIGMVRGNSDASGAWKLEHVPPGDFVLLASTAEGPAGKLPIVVTDRDQPDLLIALEKRASVSGRVIDTKGAPVSGIKVLARPDRHTRMRVVTADSMGQGTTTSADGSFKIVGLEAGKYRITSDDNVDLLVLMAEKKKPPEPIDIASGADATGALVTVEAHDGVIRGVVTARGKATRDAWVTARLQPPEGEPPWPSEIVDSEPVPTDASGTFVIDHLRGGAYTLIADGPRGASHGEKTGVKLGDTTTIELQSFGTLTGHVMIGAVPVASYDLECRGPPGPIDTRVDAADGGYSLDHLPPGHYRCSVSAKAGNAAGEVNVPGTLDLAMVPWATVTGIAISALSGAPVSRLHADVLSDSGGGDKTAASSIFSGDNRPESDAAGRFTIDHVANGRGHVALWPHSITHPLASKEYTATPGQRIDVGTVMVVPPLVGDAGTLGMEAKLSGDALEVTTVTAGGPAAQAGIVSGDKITAIQGNTIAELTPTVAQQLVASGAIGAGQTIALTLARGTTVSVNAAKW